MSVSAIVPEKSCGNKKCYQEEAEAEKRQNFGLFGIALKWPWHGCVQLFWYLCVDSVENSTRDANNWSIPLFLFFWGCQKSALIYIVDLQNFATASRRYTGDIHIPHLARGRFVYDTNRTHMEATRSRHGWVHIFITHCPTVTLQLHNFDLFKTCRTSSFCTVAWQLARFQLTRCIARSLGYSWASCQW